MILLNSTPFDSAAASDRLYPQGHDDSAEPVADCAPSLRHEWEDYYAARDSLRERVERCSQREWAVVAARRGVTQAQILLIVLVALLAGVFITTTHDEWAGAEARRARVEAQFPLVSR